MTITPKILAEWILSQSEEIQCGTVYAIAHRYRADIKRAVAFAPKDTASGSPGIYLEPMGTHMSDEEGASLQFHAVLSWAPGDELPAPEQLIPVASPFANSPLRALVDRIALEMLSGVTTMLLQADPAMTKEKLAFSLNMVMNALCAFVIKLQTHIDKDAVAQLLACPSNTLRDQLSEGMRVRIKEFFGPAVAEEK